MSKEIESKFIEGLCGTLHLCFEWLFFSKARTGKQKAKLEELIIKKTRGFDDCVLYGYNSPLLEEIADNLASYQEPKERSRYIFELLKPFKEYGAIMHPVEEVKDREEDVRRETDKEVIAFIQKQINGYKERQKKCNEVLSGEHLKESVGSCFCALYGVVVTFANMLDAKLLEMGLNLLWYQKEMGIYIKTCRSVADIADYIGSPKMALKLIEEVEPKEEVKQIEELQTVPKELCAVAKSNRPKGKPNETFKDRLMDGVEGKRLKKLHSLIDGRIGKGVALVILMATEKGWMINKPTFTQVREEFGDIGDRSGYYKYMKTECYSDVEKKGVLSLLEE